MTFSEFINKLYSCCGNGRIPAVFIEDFLKNIVDEYDEKILLKDETEYRKYFNAVKSTSKKPRTIPKPMASYLLTHLDSGKFEAFIWDNTNETSLNELCFVFNDEIPTATIDDITSKLESVFRKTLLSIISLDKQNSIPQREHSIEIENAISEIILRLSKMPENYTNQLTYNPITIDKKIENKYTILKKDIKNNVVNYYSYIKEQFKELSQSDASLFDRLAKEVKYRSDNLINEGNSQEVVFNKLVDWLKEKATTTQETACRAIIAFFVQNCEVFYEITK